MVVVVEGLLLTARVSWMVMLLLELELLTGGKLSNYNTLLSVQLSFPLRDYRTEYIYNKIIDFLYLLYYFVVLDCSNITQEMKYKHNGNLHTDNKLSVDTNSSQLTEVFAEPLILLRKSFP